MMIAVARRRTLQNLVLALGVTALLGGITVAQARADDRHHHRGWREREWRRHHPHYAYPAPGYAYVAPPPVVYAPPPPPVVYAPAPALSLVVPLHIR